MRRFYRIWALFTLMVLSVEFAPLFGQSVTLSGYGVVLPFYVQYQRSLMYSFLPLPQENRALLTRWRLRPEWVLSDAVFLRLEYEIDYMVSQHPFYIYQPGLGVTTRQYFNWQCNLYDKSKQQVRHFIDRLFLAWEWGNGRLVVGRQRISWGTGRVWNPTDLFNPLSPTAFDRVEKDGADAVNLQLYLGAFSDVQLVWNPTRTVPEGNTALRIRSNWHEFDFSLLGGRFDRRWVVGGDVTGNVGNAAIRGEWLVDFGSASRKGFLKYIIGADNQFTPRWYGLVEFHFNGEGKQHFEEYEFARLFRGEILNVGRQYIFLLSSYQVWALVNVSLALSQNLGDNSGYLLPSVNINAGDNLELVLGGQYFWGGDASEYGWFPRIAYLRAQYFF